ncbi:MAG: (S)-2-hydroxyglutarate dehydrogenase [Thermoleophilaceae bacterium]|jgi:2-hydroxyglutarate dehydrogenase|nr:(S)-2-hydroxyglutarate dehydrogenase [Thermoleophilaceae bacterium]
MRADPAPDQCDVAIVGAGIVGLASARELLERHPGLRVAVIEKEDEVGRHQTGHNSGVVHAGIYYPPGSLKARLCTAGARELYEYCERRGIAHERCGKVIVATTPGELPALAELERRGRANGVPGLRRLGRTELVEIEPHSTGVAALHSPHTGIVDFAAVARALADDVRAAGGAVATGTEVAGIDEGAREVRVRHGRGETRARAALVCAGAWADRLAVAAGAPADPRIVPFRGAYLRLRPERRYLVSGLIYPVPDPELPFLGVHLTRHVGGDVLIGPTALLAPARDAYSLRTVRARDLREALAWPGTWRMARRFWRTGLAELGYATSRRRLVEAAARFVPELRPGDVTDGPAGVRAQGLARDGRLVDDFVFSRTGRTLHVRNAPSPAATSALAIAREIAEQAAPLIGRAR